jgi:hypothetical protein
MNSQNISYLLRRKMWYLKNRPHCTTLHPEKYLAGNAHTAFQDKTQMA